LTVCQPQIELKHTEDQVLRYGIDSLFDGPAIQAIKQGKIFGSGAVSPHRQKLKLLMSHNVCYI
jgi:hypothetical protein